MELRLFLLGAIGFILLPVATYMMVKFGAAAYFREKGKYEQTNKKKT